jgi:hypothetical protein
VHLSGTKLYRKIKIASLRAIRERPQILKVLEGQNMVIRVVIRMVIHMVIGMVIRMVILYGYGVLKGPHYLSCLPPVAGNILSKDPKLGGTPQTPTSGLEWKTGVGQ